MQMPSSPSGSECRKVYVYLDPFLWSPTRCLQGISAYAPEQKWSLQFGKVPRALPDLEAIGARFDGAIAYLTEESQAAALARMSPILVGIDAPYSPHFTAAVQPDDRAIGEAAAEHFLERGYRNAAVVPHQFDHGYGTRRAQAFTSFLQRWGVKVHQFEHTEASRHLMGADVVEWIRSCGLPLAVFGIDDLIASQTMRQCILAGLRVPEQVAILGAENLEEVRYTAAVGLSSIDVPFGQIGFHAARILHQMMDGLEPEERTLLVPPTQVVTRQSTDALAIEHPLLSRAYRFLRERVHLGAGVAEMVAHLHVSRRQLERKSLEVWGCTPMEMVLRTRIDRAKQLLIASNRTVDDIADGSGFASSRAFFKQFKRLTRLTPAEFRRQHSARR